MEPVIGILTFIAIAFGALTGLWLARHLPKAHLSSESRTAVSVSMAVVGTLAALVMSLLISSASSSFNAKTDALHRLAVDIIRLDRTLRQYGSAVGSQYQPPDCKCAAQVTQLHCPLWRHSRSFRNRISRGATKPEWLPGSSIGSLSQ